MGIGLYIFDMRTGKQEFLDIGFLLDEKTQTAIESALNNIGVKLKVEGISNAEDIVKEYYEKSGYKVEKLYSKASPFSYGKETITNYLADKYKLQYPREFEGESIYTAWQYFLTHAGVPDYLIYKESNKKIKELFFCEVKSENDAVRFNQFKWYFRTNAPIKIIFTEAQIEKL